MAFTEPEQKPRAPGSFQARAGWRRRARSCNHKSMGKRWFGVRGSCLPARPKHPMERSFSAVPSRSPGVREEGMSAGARKFRYSGWKPRGATHRLNRAARTIRGQVLSDRRHPEVQASDRAADLVVFSQAMSWMPEELIMASAAGLRADLRFGWNGAYFSTPLILDARPRSGPNTPGRRKGRMSPGRKGYSGPIAINTIGNGITQYICSRKNTYRLL